MKNVRFDTICNIVQPPQELHRCGFIDRCACCDKISSIAVEKLQVNKGSSGKLASKRRREKIRTVIGFEPRTCDIYSQDNPLSYKSLSSITVDFTQEIVSSPMNVSRSINYVSKQRR